MINTHRQGRNEFEVLTLGMCLLIGSAQVFYAQRPRGVTGVSDAFLTTWAWLLFLGPVIALIGVFWRDAYTGLVLELTGLLCVVGMTISYVIIIVGTSAQSASSMVGVPLTLAFGLASLRRCWRIVKKIFPTQHRKDGMLLDEVHRQFEKKAIEEFHKRDEDDEGTV